MAENHGGVVVSGGGHFLLRAPAGRFGGLAWTFAKTSTLTGESAERTALRAVREKTGYDALVRARLSGPFDGARGPATYFLMEARHPPAAPNWQTAAIRWAQYDEAIEMIWMSSNASARQRDLALLDAARASVENLSCGERLIVHPADWSDLQPMPRAHAILHPDLAFDAAAMERIARGFVKHDMDAKWFIYLDGTRLKLHRSWTGNLVFDAGFAFDSDGGASVADLVVNRDRAQYNSSGDAEDLELFANVVRWHLLEALEW